MTDFLGLLALGVLVLSPAEMARRAAWVREIHRVARSWNLESGEIENLLFARWLIDAGRIGEGDS